MALTDYWDQYRDAHHQSIKITGYPTEKNLAMIKMIVGASSDEGDLVVDPFCGLGTTLHAARDLGRQYPLVWMLHSALPRRPSAV